MIAIAFEYLDGFLVTSINLLDKHSLLFLKRSEKQRNSCYNFDSNKKNPRHLYDWDRKQKQLIPIVRCTEDLNSDLL